MNFIKVKNFSSARYYQDDDKTIGFKGKYLQITYLTTCIRIHTHTLLKLSKQTSNSGVRK